MARVTACWLGAVVCAGCSFSGNTPGQPVIDAQVTPDGDGTHIDGAPRTDWWDPAWKTRNAIDVDTSKLSGAVAGFPLLIRLQGSAIEYAKVGTGGAALRFVASDHTTVLPHEIETFATGDSYAWVKVSLDPVGTTARLYVYYDNAEPPTTSNAAGVFGDFVSVHHMGTNGLIDASGHGHTAAPPSAVQAPSSSTTHVGTVSTFDGNNDYLELPNEGDFDFSTALSASAWVRISGFDVQFQTIVAKGDAAWRLQRNDNQRTAQFGTNDPADNLNGGRTVDDDAWHHVAIAYDGTTKSLFVDGNLDGMMNAGAITNSAFSVRIGMNEQAAASGRPGGARYWKGSIDELRIHASPRPASWFRAEFLTVTDATFAMVGAAERY